MDYVPGREDRIAGAARRARLRLRRRLGPLRRRARGRRRRLGRLGARDRPGPGLGALLRDARRGRPQRPLRHPRPPRPGQGLGRRAPPARGATRASTTSLRSRRSPRPAIAVEVSTAGLRKPVGELYPSDAFAEMCVDAGAAFALSSDAHVPRARRLRIRSGGGGDARLGGRGDLRLRAPRAPHGAARMTGGSRVGIGYDSHRFAAGRRLVLGGVEIEHDLGLEGHSDADVVTHAVIDAVLGAAGLGDLGTHFPPGEERWRDADSLDLLRTVLGMLSGPVVNVDATVICEAPRLGEHRAEMERNLAAGAGGAGERQGDHQRGHGFRRPRGGHRLHGGGARRHRWAIRFCTDGLREPARARPQGQARLARPAGRRALQREDARRGRRDPADPAGQARPRRARARALGRLARRRDRRGRDHPPGRRDGDRRGRLGDLRRDAPALQRPRARARATGASSPATASRSWPATTAASSTRPSLSRSWAPTAST